MPRAPRCPTGVGAGLDSRYGEGQYGAGIEAGGTSPCALRLISTPTPTPSWRQGACAPCFWFLPSLGISLLLMALFCASSIPLCLSLGELETSESNVLFSIIGKAVLYLTVLRSKVCAKLCKQCNCIRDTRRSLCIPKTRLQVDLCQGARCWQ